MLKIGCFSQFPFILSWAQCFIQRLQFRYINFPRAQPKSHAKLFFTRAGAADLVYRIPAKPESQPIRARSGVPAGIVHTPAAMSAANAASRRDCAKCPLDGLYATHTDDPICLDGAESADERPSAASSRGDGRASF